MIKIIKIFFLAIISAALAVVAEQMLAAMAQIFWGKEVVLETYGQFTWFLAMSAAIEEISKYWAIYFVLTKKIGLERMKFILAALFFGSMWGLFEIGIVLKTSSELFSKLQSANPEIILSLASIIALHAITAFLMAVFISANAFPGRLKHVKILFFPVLIHLLFNFLIIQKGDFTNYLLILALFIPLFAALVVLSLNFRKLA